MTYHENQPNPRIRKNGTQLLQVFTGGCIIRSWPVYLFTLFNLFKMKTYRIEYGVHLVDYYIDCDGETNNAIITSVILNGDSSDDIAAFDAADWRDIKFHCTEDYGNRVQAHYLKTGESL